MQQLRHEGEWGILYRVGMNQIFQQEAANSKESIACVREKLTEQQIL